MPVHGGGSPHQSLAAVLGAVVDAPRDRRPASRADVATATGLTRTTVSAHVERLLDARLLREVLPRPRTGAGRPAVGLELSGERVAALGAEIGVDHLAGCVVDLAGTVRAREVLPGDLRGSAPDDVLVRSAALAGRLLRAARKEGLDVVGATWGVPGLVDGGGRRVLLAPNLGWAGVDAAAVLEQQLPGLRVGLDNEATLAAVAELAALAAPAASAEPAALSEPSAPSSFVLVSGEIGIGAGVVVGGRALRGEHGWSGELGHVTVDPAGSLCRCGSRGCLETVAGQEALLRAVGGAARTGTVLGAAGGGAAVLASARAGDPGVLAALDRAGSALGVALSAAVNLLDVEVVVLGGLHALLEPWLRAPLERELGQRVLRARLQPVRVLVSRTGPDAAMLGAAATQLREVLDAPEAHLAAAGAGAVGQP